jgi:hypothetical protein
MMPTHAFSGGEKLEAYLRELAQKVSAPGTLEVGFMEGATYPDGTSVPMVAAIQEFGAPANNIPPRPFFRGMIAKDSPHWGDQLGTLLKATQYDGSRALELMGEEIKGELTESIRDFGTPANSESTVDQKGFNDPLIDTGHMINSITARVKE